MIAFVSPADIGNSLREAFFMFWETLWALVLGFTLSGAVQAFVSKRRMQRVLGDHRAPAVARASGFGMMSSSCSYAATAMAKSLFQKGADFTTAMIFMFASTNLVVELGVVLLVLMGWQFALAEFVGGPIMIVGLALVGGLVFSPRLVRAARARLERAPATDASGSVHARPRRRRRGSDETASIGTKAGWGDAAAFTFSDLRMLRRELVVGYLVAGFLTVLVPMEWWNDVFLHGHGFWTTLENALLGPFIAVISFVCSIGNVPMAAALWHGGIGFGGVVSFIFADLITLPLLLIYRKYYGTALTLRLFATFWVLMSIAGLAVEGIFQLFGAVPTNRPEAVVPDRFQWNYTTFLNLAFLVVLGVLFWLYRQRRAGGGDGRYATDPVCGMQVEKANAPAHLVHDGADVWFCSDGCCARYSESREIGASRCSVAFCSDEQDRRHPRDRAEPFVRVLPAEDARGRTAARGDVARPRTAAPHVRVGHLRRGRNDPRDDARHRHAYQPRYVADRDGAPHLRRAHARGAHRDRHALRRRGHPQHLGAARRSAQGSRSSARRPRRTRPTSSISYARSAISRSVSRCIPRGIPRRPIVRPTGSGRPRSWRAPTSASRSSSSSPTCGSSSSATYANTASRPA